MTACNYIVIFLSLAMLALLLTYEWKRANRARLPWRVPATVILVAALAVIALPITYKRVAPVKNISISRGDDPISPGVASIYWRRTLRPGETCRIQGRFYNPGGRQVKLLLTGMHTVLDSAEISSGEFRLKTVPLQTGRAVYRLIALDGADTLEQEPIPLEVVQGKALKVLILAASPDFEYRFLAGWLAGKGHGVVVRTTISKGKYDRADLNMAPGPVDHLSPALLEKFDVVIADSAALKVNEAMVRRQVAEKGMGLIIRSDSGYKDIFRPGGRTLIYDSLHRPLVSASMYGAGRIIRTGLQSTYSRLLAGDKNGYAALWTSLLQEAAERDAGEERWQLDPLLPLVDQPVKVLLRHAGNGLPQGFFEKEDGSGMPVVSYLEQRSLQPFAWEGLYWPSVAGWQSIRTSESDRT
ncbi:MAG TPA: hypothetical protein VHC48_07510, partial [Puia sp.]|nr:hypothetical protein [Puia sp.]